MLAYENFRQIFEHSKRAYWWLYQGRTKQEGKLIGSNIDNENYVESWDALAFLIEQYGDGVYTIEMRTSPNGGRGAASHTFFVGDEPTSAAAVGSVARSHLPGSGGADAAFTKGIDMRYWLDKCDRQSDKIRELELKLIAAENENNRLREQIDNPNTPGWADKIMGIVEKRPEIISHITGMFAGGQAPAAIGQLKAKAPVPPAAKKPAPEHDAEEYEDEEYDEDETPAVPPKTFSLDRAAAACYRLMRALPEQDINALLEKLAAVAENNPNKIKTAISFL